MEFLKGRVLGACRGGHLLDNTYIYIHTHQMGGFETRSEGPLFKKTTFSNKRGEERGDMGAAIKVADNYVKPPDFVCYILFTLTYTHTPSLSYLCRCIYIYIDKRHDSYAGRRRRVGKRGRGGGSIIY